MQFRVCINFMILLWSLVAPAQRHLSAAISSVKKYEWLNFSVSILKVVWKPPIFLVLQTPQKPCLIYQPKHELIVFDFYHGSLAYLTYFNCDDIQHGHKIRHQFSLLRRSAFDSATFDAGNPRGKMVWKCHCDLSTNFVFGFQEIATNLTLRKHSNTINYRPKI